MEYFHQQLNITVADVELKLLLSEMVFCNWNVICPAVADLNVAKNTVYHLQVQGIGPTFKLTVNLQNTSMNIPSSNMMITFMYDDKLYSVQRTLIHVSTVKSCLAAK